MVLNAALLNTQHKVKIKSKMEQSKEWSSAHRGVIAIEKRGFGSSSTKVVNFIYLLLYKNIPNFAPVPCTWNHITLYKNDSYAIEIITWNHIIISIR